MNKTISEHILILQDFIANQRELVNLLQNPPTTEFEANSYQTKAMEYNHQSTVLSEALRESIQAISRIDTTNQTDQSNALKDPLEALGKELRRQPTTVKKLTD